MNDREGFSAKEKEMMLMPRETRLGIIVTGIPYSYFSAPIIFNFS